MSNLFNDPITRIVSEIESLKKRLSALGSARSLYLVLNENSPTQLTASVNDYAPGDYDVLRMSSDASRNITGISGGKKGRVLRILNVGAQNIVLVHQSASSAVANRFTSPTGASITLGANDGCILYYDSTSTTWRFMSVAN